MNFFLFIVAGCDIFASKRASKQIKTTGRIELFFFFASEYLFCFYLLAMQNDETLNTIRYQRGSLSVLDQLKLPDDRIYIPIYTVDDAWKAIHTMTIRGKDLRPIVQ